MRINFGLERRRTDAKRKRFEAKNGTIELPQFTDADWDARFDEIHPIAMKAIQGANPGWIVRGYALIRESSNEN